MALPRRLSAVLLAALLLVPCGASAAQDQQRLDSTVRYLQDVQHKDGGFGENGSSPLFSAWAAYAVAAAGVNPKDQRKPGGVDAYTYLTRHTSGLRQTTDFARVALVASAAGGSAQRFGDVDAVAGILANQRSDGSFSQLRGGPTAVNATTFAVLALEGIDPSTLRGGVTRAQLSRRSGRALDWLAANQKADGSFAGVDITASGIEALNAGGRKNTAAQAKALEYIRSRQNPDGGFGEGELGDSSNSASTSWVARALAAARVSVRSFQGAGTGKTPLDYLAAMQQSDGSVRYSATEDTNRVWITTFTTPALAGTSLPLAAVDRADPEDTTSRRSETPAAKPKGDDGSQPGAGGTADGGDGEVTAGGGGDSAPLFSQPKPGSRGIQPGGQRQTDRPSRATGQGDGAVAGESVAGKLVGQGKLAATGKGRSLGSAPGLRAAAAGGEAPSGLVAGIGIALVLCAFGGMYLERRGAKGGAA